MLLIDANGVDPEVLCLQIERGLMKSSVAVRTDIKCTVIDQDALCTLWAPGIRDGSLRRSLGQIPR